MEVSTIISLLLSFLWDIFIFLFKVLASLFSIFFPVFLYVAHILKEEASRKKYIEELRGESPKKSKREEYKTKLKFFLDKFDIWLGKPFSPEAININTFLSICYSFLFFMISWVVGGSGEIASVQVLGKTVPVVWRIISVILFCMSFILFFLYSINFKRDVKKVDNLFLALLLALAGVVALAGLVVLAGVAAVAVAVLLALAGAVAVLFASAGAGPRALAVTVAVVVALAVTVALAVAVTVTVGLTLAVTVAVPGLLGVALLVIVIVVVSSRGKNYQRTLLSLYITSIIFSALFLLFMSQYDFNLSRHLVERIVIVFFIVLLPFINGFLDWLSLSFSKFLGRKIIKKAESFLSIFLLLIADCFFAFFFLGALIFILSCSIELFDIYILKTAEFKINVSQYINSMKENSIFFTPDNLWITLMLFSTLIPTALHFITALWFIPHTQLVSPKMKNKIANSIENSTCGKDRTSPAFWLTVGRTLWLCLGGILPVAFLFVLCFSIPHLLDLLYFLAEYGVQVANINYI